MSYNPAIHFPPPPPMPSATLSPKGVLYLSKAFMAALNLRTGQAASLLGPMPGSTYWHFDLREQAPHRINWSGSLKDAVRGQSARVRGLKAVGSTLTETLTLYLLPGEPHYPGFYPLLPADALTP